MREIKFRAWWHAEKAEYRRGVQTNPDAMYYDEWPGQCLKFAHEGQPVTIMQYTGLKDKNGKEIYEGDLFKQKGLDDELIIGVVIFDDGYHGFRVQEGEYIFHWLKFAGEIVGNLYENPGLLEARA